MYSTSLQREPNKVRCLQNELQAVRESLDVERAQRGDNISEVQTLCSEKANILDQLRAEKDLLKQMQRFTFELEA